MTTALLLDILDKHLKEAQTIYIAGWSSPVARRAHNPKVVSSNLAPATKEFQQTSCGLAGIFRYGVMCEPTPISLMRPWLITRRALLAGGERQALTEAERRPSVQIWPPQPNWLQNSAFPGFYAFYSTDSNFETQRQQRSHSGHDAQFSCSATRIKYIIVQHY